MKFGTVQILPLVGNEGHVNPSIQSLSLGVLKFLSDLDDQYDLTLIGEEALNLEDPNEPPSQTHIASILTIGVWGDGMYVCSRETIFYNFYLNALPIQKMISCINFKKQQSKAQKRQVWFAVLWILPGTWNLILKNNMLNVSGVYVSVTCGAFYTSQTYRIRIFRTRVQR